MDRFSNLLLNITTFMFSFKWYQKLVRTSVFIDDQLYDLEYAFMFLVEKECAYNFNELDDVKLFMKKCQLSDVYLKDDLLENFLNKNLNNYKTNNKIYSLIKEIIHGISTKCDIDKSIDELYSLNTCE